MQLPDWEPSDLFYRKINYRFIGGTYEMLYDRDYTKFGELVKGLPIILFAPYYVIAYVVYFIYIFLNILLYIFTTPFSED